MTELKSHVETRPLERLTFDVPGMDCGSEEQLIRMRLAGRDDVKSLRFDLPARTVVVVHSGDAAAIERSMIDLQLGAKLAAREAAVESGADDAADASQRKLLYIVLAINAVLFAVELCVGWIAQSMGLIADSLDMLADAFVYGLSLYAIGRSAGNKRRVAAISGYLQLALAASGLIEVVRRFLGAGDEPSFGLMIGMSIVSFIGNIAALMILQRGRSEEVHMRASWIFTSNDVLVNLGVLVAGLLVYATSSRLPDLLIGAIVFCLVGYGAFRILRLARV